MRRGAMTSLANIIVTLLLTFVLGVRWTLIVSGPCP